MGAWGPGHLQSSAEGPRRLGRAGSEDSCLAPGGDVWIPGGDVQIPGGGLEQWTFQCPSMPQLGHGPGGGLSLGMSSPVTFFAAFEAGPRGLPSLFVGGGLELCRAVAQRWYLA